MDQARRSLLRAIGSAALAGSLAGCGLLGGDGTTTEPGTPAPTSPPADGSPTPTGTQSTPTPSTPTPTPTKTAPPPASDDGATGYARWLASASIFDQSHYHFVGLQPASMLANSSAYEGTATLTEMEEDKTPGLTMADNDGVYLLNKRLTTGESLNFTQAIEGGIDPGPVRDLLGERFQLHRRGDYAGYTLYARKNLLGAVSDDDFILFQSSRGLPVLKQLIETSRGTAPRYRAESADCEALLAALGTGHDVTYGRTNEAGEVFPNGVARGAAWRAADGELTFREIGRAHV